MPFMKTASSRFTNTMSESRESEQQKQAICNDEQPGDWGEEAEARAWGTKFQEARKKGKNYAK